MVVALNRSNYADKVRFLGRYARFLGRNSRSLPRSAICEEFKAYCVAF